MSVCQVGTKLGSERGGYAAHVSLIEELGLDWDYLSIAAHVPHEFVDQGQNIAELVLFVC